MHSKEKTGEMMRYEYTHGHFTHIKQKTENTAIIKSTLHIHDEYEIIYILTGSPSFFISGSTYITKPGDIVLLRGLEIHSMPHSGITDTLRNEILFSPDIIKNVFHEGTQLLSMFDDRKKGDRNHIRPDTKTGIMLRALFEGFDISSRNRCKHAPSKTYAQFLNILHKINEAYETRSVFVPENSLAHDLVEVIRYIDANIRSPLCLCELGRIFFLSPQHLIRLFKKYTGCTIHEYIVNKRLIRAKELIKKGNDLESSCDSAGFCSYSGFYRSFKTKTGISPSQYSRIVTSGT